MNKYVLAQRNKKNWTIVTQKIICAPLFLPVYSHFQEKANVRYALNRHEATVRSAHDVSPLVHAEPTPF